jgi:hypothetical protein
MIIELARSYTGSSLYRGTGIAGSIITGSNSWEERPKYINSAIKLNKNIVCMGELFFSLQEFTSFILGMRIPLYIVANKTKNKIESRKASKADNRPVISPNNISQKTIAVIMINIILCFLKK